MQIADSTHQVKWTALIRRLCHYTMTRGFVMKKILAFDNLVRESV
jgi:hypothetical protein